MKSMKILQVKLLYNYTYITIVIWIANIFLYNLAVSTDTVTEWVARYEDPILYERDMLFYWGQMDREFYTEPYITKESVKSIQADDLDKESAVDGNTTCEGAAYMICDTSETPINSVSPILPTSLQALSTDIESLKNPANVSLPSAQQALSLEPVDLANPANPASPSLQLSKQSVLIVPEPIQNMACPATLDLQCKENIAHDTSEALKDKAHSNQKELPVAKKGLPSNSELVKDPAVSAIQATPELWRTEEGYLTSLRERFKDIKLDPTINIIPEIIPSEYSMVVVEELLTQTEAAVINMANTMRVTPEGIPEKLLRTIIFEVVKQNKHTPSWVCYTEDDMKNTSSTCSMMLSSIDYVLSLPDALTSFRRTLIIHVETCILLLNDLTVANQSDTYHTKIQSTFYTELFNQISDNSKPK
jgi:hypothetical protein